MENEDYNINNYSLKDLINLFNLPKNYDENVITSILDPKISSFIDSNNTQMTNFTYDAKKKLIEDLGDNFDSDEEERNLQREQWYNNEYPKFDDPQQSKNFNNRKQSVDVFASNTHPIMNKKFLGNIPNTKPIDVAQDTMNPVLRTSNIKHICIDSQYRSIIFPNNSNSTSNSYIDDDSLSTNFTCNLTDKIKNTLSLKLQTLNIPCSWYTFSNSKGNNCFWIALELVNLLTAEVYSSNSGKTYDPLNTIYPVSIPEGNYNIIYFVQALQNSLDNVLTLMSITQPIKVGLNILTNKISIKNNHILGLTLIFFKDGLSCNQVSCGSNIKYNKNLGWNMGFRLEPNSNPLYSDNSIYGALVSQTIAGNGGVIFPAAPINLQGSKYFLLVLDDFNQNHQNDGLISIAGKENKLSIPSYANKAADLLCYTRNTVSPPAGYYSNINYDAYIPGQPRLLTQAQLYSLNQININRNESNQRDLSPNNSNVLAIISIPNINSEIVSIGIDTSAEDYLPSSNSSEAFYSLPKISSSNILRANYSNEVLNITNFIGGERNYYGPVSLERLGVKLIDDEGDLVNLNGRDWSFTLQVQDLYQY